MSDIDEEERRRIDKTYPRWDSLRNDQKCPCETCDCGRCEYCNLSDKEDRRKKRYTGNNNCAHYLSNYLIVEKGLTAVQNPLILLEFNETDDNFTFEKKRAECCPMGRPIRAKQMASVDALHGVFEYVLGMAKSMNSPGENCYMYSQQYSKGGVGHVYYGTKSDCAVGTGSGERFEMEYFEYYYKAAKPSVTLQKIRYYDEQKRIREDGKDYVWEKMPESEIQR